MGDWGDIWDAVVARLPLDASAPPTEAEWARLVITIDTIGRYLIGLPEPSAERNAKALMEGLGLLDQIYDLHREMTEMVEKQRTAAPAAAPDLSELRAMLVGIAERVAVVDEQLGSHMGSFNTFVRRTESSFRSIDQITIDLRHDVEILKGHRPPRSEPGAADDTERDGAMATEVPSPRRDVDPSPSTPDRILQALRDHGGHQRQAAAASGIPVGTISSVLHSLRQKGQLPADVAALLAARQSDRLDRKGERGGSERVAAMQREERERVRGVATVIAARQPNQNERVEETFEERRARIARDRANANMSPRTV